MDLLGWQGVWIGGHGGPSIYEQSLVLARSASAAQSGTLDIEQSLALDIMLSLLFDQDTLPVLRTYSVDAAMRLFTVDDMAHSVEIGDAPRVYTADDALNILIVNDRPRIYTVEDDD